MPGYDLVQQPQYPVRVLDTDVPVTSDQFRGIMDGANGVTLCIRSKSGAPQRGGYFFCITQQDGNQYGLETVEGTFVDSFDETTLLKLVNHVSGRRFDKEMLEYCQNSINFRADD